MSNTYPFTAEKLTLGSPDGSGFVPIGQVFQAPTGEQILVPMMIPDENTYHDEVLRLSQKATNGRPYTSPEWSDLSATTIRYRSKAMDIFRGVHLEIREMHDDTLPPTASLREVQAIQQLPSTSGIQGAESVQILAYSVGQRIMQVLEIGAYVHEDGEKILRQELAMGALLGTSNPQEKHWTSFYLLLLQAAGERLKPAPNLSKAEIEKARQAWRERNQVEG